MATLPRSTSKSVILQRPTSDFDTGINTSTAWTEHLDSGVSSSSTSIPHPRSSSRKYLSESGIKASASLSDDEGEEDEEDEETTRPARALYKFEGKPEFRELDVDAGDEIEVLKEDVGDGWSLIRNKAGEVGLLPQTYYTFTAEFTPSLELEFDTSPNGKQYPRKRERSSSSMTPRGSPRSSEEPLQPIIPQNTGEWRGAFPSFRQSLLGGKSLNRFSSFVTSGAEEFVLKGTPSLPEGMLVNVQSKPSTSAGHAQEESTSLVDEGEQKKLDRAGLGEADRHFVDAGPAWKEKVPPFRVLVHSPSKRLSILSGAYTIYNVTSLFHVAPAVGEERFGNYEATDGETTTRLTVLRRFSHFVILHTALTRRLPGIALPPLPDKQYAGRFSNDFVEARRGDLERYISKIVRHPVARYAEILTFFLSCESDTEWKRLLPEYLSIPPAGPNFYARVYHPAFNIDPDEAQDSVNTFEAHTRAVGKGVQALRNIFGRVREARIEMSKAERLLSYSLLSLITSKPLATASTTGTSAEDERQSVRSKGLFNEDGAWCWREGCQDCLKLTKAMQKVSDSLQHIADLYDDHARRTLLATHESLKSMAHPSSVYESVITTHRSTLSRYQEASAGGYPDGNVAGRCETVLNTTLAEMNTYHVQKFEDFQKLTKEHLDGEIQFYEQVIIRLQAARRNLNPTVFNELGSSPRQTSIFERDLENPKLNPQPLQQPCPHVFDSAPMRPVSVAIQEGVNIFLGPPGRGSVFSKFW